LKVYDPSFLVETRRALAKWELAQKVVLPKEEDGDGQRQITPGQEETIAETRDKDGNPLGRWVVTWSENGEGTCRELGHIERRVFSGFSFHSMNLDTHLRLVAGTSMYTRSCCLDVCWEASVCLFLLLRGTWMLT
jgi:hypothetical protein